MTLNRCHNNNSLNKSQYIYILISKLWGLSLSKRAFDIFFSILLLPILLPLIAVFSVVLVIVNKQSPFFVQKRGITLSKFCLKIIKLRTIRVVENNKYNNSVSKSIFFKSFHKDNISRFSGWLRRTGLDEIPQVFNVLKGDMSFVGPRPLMISDLKLMKKTDWEYYKLRGSFTSKPGITGLWQIFCNRDEGTKNLIALEKMYEDMKSFKYDLKILLYTVPIVLTANNADAVFSSIPFPVDGTRVSQISTEISFVFEKTVAKKKIADEYSVKLAGKWWSDNHSPNNVIEDRSSSLKLIKIKPSVKRVS